MIPSSTTLCLMGIERNISLALFGLRGGWYYIYRNGTTSARFWASQYKLEMSRYYARNP